MAPIIVVVLSTLLISKYSHCIVVDISRRVVCITLASLALLFNVYTWVSSNSRSTGTLVECTIICVVLATIFVKLALLPRGTEMSLVDGFELSELSNDVINKSYADVYCLNNMSARSIIAFISVLSLTVVYFFLCALCAEDIAESSSWFAKVSFLFVLNSKVSMVLFWISFWLNAYLTAKLIVYIEYKRVRKYLDFINGRLM